MITLIWKKQVQIAGRFKEMARTTVVYIVVGDMLQLMGCSSHSTPYSYKCAENLKKIIKIAQNFWRFCKTLLLIWQSFPIKFQEWGCLEFRELDVLSKKFADRFEWVACLEINLNIIICKPESSLSHEIKAWSADSSKACLTAFYCCIKLTD